MDIALPFPRPLAAGGRQLEQVEQATQGAEVVELAGKMRLQLISFGLSRLGGATGCS